MDYWCRRMWSRTWTPPLTCECQLVRKEEGGIRRLGVTEDGKD